ncbi:MAG: glycosyltransferase [Thermoanaerobaculia bacterium]|nr:glycosyltransferase [Thermoanaerobaculia bacterium]
MVLGKPVIATPYSGVTDFFDLNTGYPVRYRTLELTQDTGPYQAGSHWADPDVDHAAERMLEVVERRDEAHAVGRRASEDLSRRLSYAAVGKTLRERYEEVLRTVRQGQLGGRL